LLLVNEKGEQIVSLAVPIHYRKTVQGVLLLSTRPGEIDEVLAEERNIILALAGIALAATLLASMLHRPHHCRPHGPALRRRRERQPQHQDAA